MAAALAAIWDRRRDEMEARAGVIEQAVAALLEDRLDEDLRAEAERSAHKLAGSLGTFGVPTGSELASEVEHVLAGAGPASADIPRLAELALGIAEQIERGPQATPPPELPGGEAGAAGPLARTSPSPSGSPWSPRSSRRS